ncbi:hypothetical protein ACI48D_00715 [Massilia sp. LXY-6]|uniref:hypothetical protein n=1 Tax=Massilia sp. LXY-6 TaxID=3379823 RepID=UPI003EE0A858
MTYLRTTHPRIQSTKRRFERRIDDRTASDIGDALRADGTQAAALAMQHLQVDVQVALRVLAGAKDEPGRISRRMEPADSADA